MMSSYGGVPPSLRVSRYSRMSVECSLWVAAYDVGVLAVPVCQCPSVHERRDATYHRKNVCPHCVGSLILNENAQAEGESAAAITASHTGTPRHISIMAAVGGAAAVARRERRGGRGGSDGRSDVYLVDGPDEDE